MQAKFPHAGTLRGTSLSLLSLVRAFVSLVPLSLFLVYSASLFRSEAPRFLVYVDAHIHLIDELSLPHILRPLEEALQKW